MPPMKFFRCLTCGFSGEITEGEVAHHRARCQLGTTEGLAEPINLPPVAAIPVVTACGADPGNPDIQALATAASGHLHHRLAAVAIDKAYCLAARAHAKQFDKAGEPYFYHVLRVGIQLLPDVEACILGLLHDVLEDCPEIGKQEIVETLDSNSSLFEDLIALTKTSGEPYSDYLARVAARPLAVKVKIADLRDNTRVDRVLAAIGHGASGKHMSELLKRNRAALHRLERLV